MLPVNVWICLMIMISQQEPSPKQKNKKQKNTVAHTSVQVRNSHGLACLDTSDSNLSVKKHLGWELLCCFSSFCYSHKNSVHLVGVINGRL